MKILLIGGGGREHAMAEALARSPLTTKLYAAPGSDGMAELAESVRLSATDLDGLVRFARDVGIDLTVVGPEAPLVAGLRDRFDAEGLKLFGPSQAAAALEGSKIFTKKILHNHRMPTADSRVFDNPRAALYHLESQGRYPRVIKADGLAAGKGVVIVHTKQQAEKALDFIMVRREFGAAGDRILVEEFLEGEECSVLAITDGKSIAPLATAKDHKAVFDGDQGPNTGGMGAYSPSPLVQGEVYDAVERDVLLPIVHAMNRERRPYQGVLYAGLMIFEGKPRILEFNVRFGDPEAQVLLPRLETDLVEIALRTIEGKLDEVGPLCFEPEPSLVVVLASEGYPGSPAVGRPITGLAEAAQVPGVRLYHSGTRQEGNTWLTTGGRVLGVMGRGETLEQARATAYLGVSKIHFEGMHFRRDIGEDADSSQAEKGNVAG